MKMIKKSTARKILKVLNTIVVLTMVLQPVGTPSILRAIAADEPATGAVSAPAPVSDPAPKTDPAPADPVAPKEEPAPTPASDPTPAPKEEPKVDPTPTPSTTIDTPKDAGTPAPTESVTTSPAQSTDPAPSNPLTAPALPTATQNDVTSTPTSTDTPVSPAIDSTPIISPDAASTEAPVIEQTGKICLEQGANIVSSDRNDWTVSGDIAETKNKVELGVKYVFPGNDNVSVTFTCLPAASADRTTLKIQQIASADINLPDGVSAASEFAYDITTGMKDGDFKYDLTLPKADVADADINYIEKSASEVTTQGVATTDLKSVDDTKVKTETNNMKVEELDHFTIFILTYTDVALTLTSTAFAQGDMIYVNATGLLASNYYRFAIDPPGNGNFLYITNDCTTGVNNLSASYALSSTAQISSDWKAEIHGFTSLNNCNNANNNHSPSDTQTFEVTAIASFVASSGSTITNGCMDDLFPGNLNCTANDISLANVSGITIIDADGGCTSPSDTVTFTADWDVASNSSQRYDIGLYFATDGDPNHDGAYTGSCSITTLPNSPTPPWFNFDGDACGDASSSANVNPTITQTVQCLDTDGDNNLNLPYCSSWRQNEGGHNDNSTCSSPTDAYPGTPSKCKCDVGFEIPITVPFAAEIEVKKDLIPGSDSGKFNLQIDGSNEATNVGDNGTTGPVEVGAGTSADPGDTHTVGEIAGTSTDLADYTSSISCVDRGETTFDGGPALVTSGAGSLSVNVDKDDDIVCTITNSFRTGSITVNKIIVNDNGGTATIANFQAKIDGSNIAWATPVIKNPGTYTVSETGVAGYVGTFSGDCDSNGQVILGASESKTCTITNDDQLATLIVKKVIVNDNGGNAVASGFSYKVNGGSSVPFESDGQNDMTVSAGTYSVAENPATGYATTYDNCSGVVIPNGGTATCTITNNDNAPSLTLNKIVVNDNGGTATESAWTLTANGGTAGTLSGPGAAGSTDVVSGSTFKAGTYTLSESGGLSGYAASAWTCTNGVTINGNSQITLGLGQSTVCSITNDDIAPTLTLVKSVTNDNGGNKQVSDFTLKIDGTTVTSGVAKTLLAGNHTASEINLPGYTASVWGQDCATDGTITLVPGDNKTCTITNDDQSGTLVVKKVVNNNFGGTKTAGDFSFVVDSGSAITFESDGQNDLTVNAGTYNVTEPAVAGYSTNYDSCANIVVPNGESATCTITNNDIKPKLTVTKVVHNNYGGTKTVSSFPLFVGATPVTSGVQNGFNVGGYVVSETPDSGYTSAISGDCASDGSIILALGDAKNCTITNDDIQPRLTVYKFVTNNNGGNLTPGDFTINVSGNSVNPASFSGDSSGTDVILNAGSYNVTENQVGGYSPDYSTDCSGSIAVGENKSCTITNDDQAPTLTLVKTVINDNGGSKQVSDFPLFISGNPATSGVAVTLSANTEYTVSETNLPGYTASSWEQDCASDGKITLKPGDNKTCTITNDDVAPTLKLVKTVTNDNGGTKIVSDFVLKIDGNNVTSGNANTLQAGSHTASEVNLPGYSASSWGGDCAANGSVALLPGDNKTCTITNDDIKPKLKVVKHVVNDGGGTAAASEFTITVAGNGASPWQFQGSEAGTDISIDAGSYVVDEDETLVAGYSKSLSADCSGTLAPGDDKICTITNDDVAPTLTLVKTVVNNNGGQATPSVWTLSATGTLGSFSGQGPTVGSTSVSAGVQYTLGESGGNPFNYAAGDWVCNGGSQDGNKITLSLANNVTCTIINDDKPATLIVKKVVVGSNDPATNFSFSVNGGGSQSFEADGQNDLTVNRGIYTVTESPASDYTTTYSTDCTNGVVENGETITCTITNTRNTGFLLVHKQYDSDGNGTYDIVNDSTANTTGFRWGLSSTPASNINSFGGSGTTLDTGSYNVYENTLVNYHPTGYFRNTNIPEGASCANPDGSALPALVDVSTGQTTEITICNARDMGALTVIKHVVGGSDDASAWTMFVRSDPSQNAITPFLGSETGTTNNLPTDTYTITELGMEKDLSNYTLTYSGDCNSQGQVTVTTGTSKTCTLTNTRDTGSIKVNKLVDTDGDGTFETSNPGNFTWGVGGIGTNAMGETVSGFTTGAQSVNENSPSDYHLVTWYITADTTQDCSNSNKTLPADINVNKDLISEITICNAVDEGSITAHKFADFDKSGVQNAGEPNVQYFQMSLYQGNGCSGSPISQLDTQSDGNAVFSNLIVGDYSVKETLPPPGLPGLGWWTNVSSLCQDVHVSYNQNQQVNFANFRVQELTVCKYNDINGDGRWQSGDNPLSGWTINLSGPENLSGVTGGDGCARIPINIYGGYVVTEVLQPGWLQTFPSEPQTAYAEYSYSSGLQLYNFQLGSISGQKFNDLNGNGTKDSGELGLSGWTINLDKNADGSVDFTTTTDSNGYYSFTGLLAGTYRVREIPQTGWAQMSTDPADVAITSGSNATDVDFGNVQQGRIIIEKQILPDGSAQPFEFDPSWSVTNFNLTDGETNDSGWLAPGAYTASETNPSTSGYRLTGITCDDANSTGNVQTGTATFNVEAGETVKCTFTNEIFGSITAHKYEDANANGVQDAGEQDLSGWQMSVYSGSDCQTGNLLGQYDTDDSGKTSFYSIVPGQPYSVGETLQNGWANISPVCQNFSVTSGEAKQVDFGNQQRGNISGMKWKDLDGDNLLGSNESLDNWTINLFQKDSNGNYDPNSPYQTVTTGMFTIGAFVFDDLLLGDYEICEVMQGGWYPINTSNGCQSITLTSENSEVRFDFQNEQYGNVTVTKFNDVENDGEYNGEEEILSDWEINFAGQTLPTDANGVAQFQNIIPNAEYILSENIQQGWEQTNIYCEYRQEENGDFLVAAEAVQPPVQIDNDNSLPITLNPGESRQCFIGNHFTPPSLVIEKSNNNPAPGIVLAPGDSVVYTLKVTAKDNDLKGVTVTDLPPDGFTYVPGSETASSDNPGHVGALTLQHAYASPGVWDLGDMKKDEVVTLTYKTNISPSQESGTYPDLAWTAGKSLVDEDVLGTGENSQYVNGAFVGTQVAVVKQGTVLGASVKIETDREMDHKKDKIVKKTRVLPATGYSPWWIAVAILILLAGAGSIYLGRKKKKEDNLDDMNKPDDINSPNDANNPDDTNNMDIMTKLLVAGLLGASLLFGAQATQAATNLAAQMMTPKSPYQTTDFDLGFVALDLNSNPVTVQCFLNGSGAPYQTINLAGGGTSGNCNVNSSVIPGSGSYQFHITATNGSESITSPDVSLEVITGGPGTPTNYNRDKVSACQNVISFTTANDDGKTVRAEIYRSTERAYTADASTLVTSIDVGSNQPASYTDIRTENCNTVYYAVRAFDALGNGSGVVSDTRTVTVTTGGGTTTVTTTTTAPGGGAIPVAAGGAVSGAATAAGGAEGGTVEGAQTPAEGAGQTPAGEEQQGEVLGEQTTNEAGLTGFQKHPYLYSLAGLIALYLLYYAYRKMGKKGHLKPPIDNPKPPLDTPPTNTTV